MKLETICEKPKGTARPTPLLVLGAADDTLITADMVRRKARRYGTEAVIFPNMAHDMMLEKDWQSVADRILQFLKERGL